MEQYHFTLRFDDEQHSLTRFNGLPANQVGELLLSLHKALSVKKAETLVLSEIRGNCYALELTTSVEAIHERLKVIHRNIGTNNYKQLNTEERKYAATLEVILGGRLSLSVYNQDRSYEQALNKIQAPPTPEYYYEISTIHGIVTSIGSYSLEGKSHIRISGLDFNIEISKEQETEMLGLFKKNRLRLNIRKKINFETDKTSSAELVEFEVLDMEQSFVDAAKAFRAKYPDAFASEVHNMSVNEPFE